MCPFCYDNKYLDSIYPPTRFNKKQFNYVRCISCSLVYVQPFPNEDDYKLMYLPSYQGHVDKSIAQPSEIPYGLRFPYSKHYNVINSTKLKPVLLADFGCGNGHFIFNALKQGIQCHGIEYNADYIKMLSAEIPDAVFYTVENFFGNSNVYDVIRLSNVLEHLDKPVEILKKIMQKLKPGGILLVEGPLEDNGNLAHSLRMLLFKFTASKRKKHPAVHAPTHIFFSNRSNQLNLFKALSFQTIEYTVTERAWPYPYKLADVKSLGGFLKWTIAKISILISLIIPPWGNTFFYAGRKSG
jgi:2-polyprenyl-3-methyl-5-hydroxy-6-metoxy-1,4-benzoquinol methylase